MLGTYRRLIILPMLCVAITACNRSQRADTLADYPLAEASRPRTPYGRHFAQMVDNAILNDLDLADFHFITHTSELSGTGEARLNRMAPLLNVYGGIVRYSTRLDDDDLIGQRMEHVREYLSLVGCDMDRTTLAVMMPGSRGATGKEAVWKYRALTSKPTGKGKGDVTVVMGDMLNTK